MGFLMKGLFMNNEQTQFVISYELLCLLHWIVEHDYEKLKKIITKSLSSGLKEELNRISQRPNTLSEEEAHEMQQSIIDFFALLEGALVDSLHDHALQKAMEKKLMPAIEHIDMAICDDATVRSSLEHASTKIEHASIDHAQEVLFKELLRRWKPSKKHILN
jgi:hypothetical protein